MLIWRYTIERKDYDEWLNFWHFLIKLIFLDFRTAGNVTGMNLCNGCKFACDWRATRDYVDPKISIPQDAFVIPVWFPRSAQWPIIIPTASYISLQSSVSISITPTQELTENMGLLLYPIISNLIDYLQAISKHDDFIIHFVPLDESMLAMGSCDDVSRIFVYILRDFEPSSFQLPLLILMRHGCNGSLPLLLTYPFGHDHSSSLIYHSFWYVSSTYFFWTLSVYQPSALFPLRY